jgi:four helix bundle protein
MKSYQDLEVWQKAMDLVVLCYKITEKFPKNETYGLASQLQRAAISIPANIAEGRHRQHSKEFLQHLSIAYASLAELETHVQIAGRLDYINQDQIDDLLNKTAELGRMLNGLRRSIDKKIHPDP